MNIPYACPQCKQKLTRRGNRYVCPNSHVEVREENGVVDFIAVDSVTYSDVAPEILDELAQDALSSGWQPALSKALSSFPGPLAEYRRHYAVSETRAAWKYLLAKPADGGVILDFGCGWGATTPTLARTFGQVVALDPSMACLAFQKHRCQQQGLTNIVYCRSGDSLHMPFADRAFDAVVLNGILARIAVNQAGDPRDNQVEFLKEVARVLKPAGQLYLGTENRTGFKYFVGSPDDYTGLRFLPLLPRSIADLWLRIRRGQIFQTYTYTRSGLRELLESAGFSHNQFFIPSRNHRKFSQIDKVDGPLSEPNLIGNTLKRRLWRKFRKMPIYRALCLSHAVVACSRNPAPSILDELIGLTLLRIRPGVPGYRLSRYIVSSANCVITEITLDAWPGFILKIPLSDMARQEIRENHQMLQALADVLPAPLRRLVPASYGESAYGGVVAFAESCLSGAPGHAALADPRFVRKVLEEGKRFLVALHANRPATRIVDAEFLAGFFQIHLAHLAVYFREKGWRDEYSLIVERLTTLISRMQLPVVPFHGDFWFGNLMLDQSHCLSGVIDWGGGALEGLPIVDLCHLVIEGQVYSHRISVEENLRSHLFDGDFRFAADYLDQFGLAPDDLDAFAALSWMLAANKKMPAWKREMAYGLIASQVDDVMPAVADRLLLQFEPSQPPASIN